MSIFKTMTKQQRRSAIAGILWMLLGIWVATRDTWLGIAWIILGLLALAVTIWDARKTSTT